MDSFEQGLLAQQVDDERVVEGKLENSFEQGPFTVEIEQQVPPMALVEQLSFLVNSAVGVSISV